MNLHFHNLKDVKPEHGRQICYINICNFYGTWEFIYATVEYSWDDGDGGQICYDPEDPSPPEDEEGFPSFELYWGCSTERHSMYYKLNDNTEGLLWAYLEDIETQIEKALPYLVEKD